MKSRNKILTMKERRRAAKNEMMSPWVEALLWIGVVALIGWAAVIMLS